MHRGFLVLATTLFAVSTLGAQQRLECHDGEGLLHSRNLGKYTLRLGPISPKVSSRSGFRGCRAELLTQVKTVVFKAEADSLWEDSASGKDINNDGKPELVLVGSNCGSHCSVSCWIVTLGDASDVARYVSILGVFANLQESDGRGQAQIRTNFAGLFRMFEGLPDFMTGKRTPADDLSIPMYLRLDRNRLVNISADSSFRTTYETEIAQWRQRVDDEQLAAFRNSDSATLRDCSEHWGEPPKVVSPATCAEFSKVKASVLAVALLYVFEGRDDEAGQWLDLRWPPSDLQRIRQTIVVTANEFIASSIKVEDPGLRLAQTTPKADQPAHLSPGITVLSGNYYVKPSTLDQLELSLATEPLLNCARRVSEAIAHPEEHPALTMDYLHQGQQIDWIFGKLNTQVTLLRRDITGLRSVVFGSPEKAEAALSEMNKEAASFRTWLASSETLPLRQYCRSLPPE